MQVCVRMCLSGHMYAIAQWPQGCCAQSPLDWNGAIRSSDLSMLDSLTLHTHTQRQRGRIHNWLIYSITINNWCLTTPLTCSTRQGKERTMREWHGHGKALFLTPTRLSPTFTFHSSELRCHHLLQLFNYNPRSKLDALWTCIFNDVQSHIFCHWSRKKKKGNLIL